MPMRAVGAAPSNSSDVVRLVDLQESVAFTSSNLQRITGFGDSYTQGNQDGSGIGYLNLLGDALGANVTAINAGSGGYTSTEVGITMGAINPVLGAFTIPNSTAATTVTVSSPTASFQPAGTTGITYSWTGYVTHGSTQVKYPGTLVRNVATDGSWTFAATTAPGGTVSIPAGSTFHTSLNDDKTSNLAIIMVGRNNPTAQSVILSDLAAMVSRLSVQEKRYLILGVVTSTAETTGNSNNTAIVALNSAIAAAYGNRFVDIRAAMMTIGLTYNDITATGSDTTAISNGTVPPSLMYTDGFHPNRWGYRTIAKATIDRLALLGWVVDQPLAISKQPPANVWLGGDFENGYNTGYTNSTQFSTNQGTIAVAGNAARRGQYGIRNAFTGTASSVAIALKLNLAAADANIAHSSSVWVRPSKTMTVQITADYYNSSFAYLNGDYGTSAVSCPANTWTRMALPGTYVPSGGALYQINVAVSTAVASGDFIDIDDVQTFAGTVAP